MTAFHIDVFSGAVTYLTTKERRDPMVVLACLAKHPRVSTWDMDEHKRFPLYKTIDVLKAHGYVKYKDGIEYPWLEFEITEAGRAALLAVTP